VVPFNGAVMALAMSPVQPCAVVGLADGSLHVLDLVAGQARRISEILHDSVRHVAYSPCGEFAVTCGKTPDGNSGLVVVWDAFSWKPLLQVMASHLMYRN
jgi:WD40 repeat protein